MELLEEDQSAVFNIDWIVTPQPAALECAAPLVELAEKHPCMSIPADASVALSHLARVDDSTCL